MSSNLEQLEKINLFCYQYIKVTNQEVFAVLAAAFAVKHTH